MPPVPSPIYTNGAKDPHKNQKTPLSPIIMSVIKDYRESKQQDKYNSLNRPQGNCYQTANLCFLFFWNSRKILILFCVCESEAQCAWKTRMSTIGCALRAVSCVDSSAERFRGTWHWAVSCPLWRWLTDKSIWAFLIKKKIKKKRLGHIKRNHSYVPVITGLVVKTLRFVITSKICFAILFTVELLPSSNRLHLPGYFPTVGAYH